MILMALPNSHPRIFKKIGMVAVKKNYECQGRSFCEKILPRLSFMQSSSSETILFCIIPLMK